MNANQASGSAPTFHRLMEPQLVSALAWALALLGMMLVHHLAYVPPEAALLVFGTLTLVLLFRVLIGRLGLGELRYQLVDPLRDGLYLGGVILALGCLMFARARALAWPSCTHIESLTMELPEKFHVADFALGALVGSLAVFEAQLFRRSFALQYLWPSSSRAYIARWLTRLVTPSLILGVALSLHAHTAPQLWGKQLQARRIAIAIRGLQPEQYLDGDISYQLEDEAVIGSLVSLAMCQPNTALAHELLSKMRKPRKQIKSEKWRVFVEWEKRQRMNKGINQ